MAIPEQFLQRLHEANESFHKARMKLNGVDEMGMAQRKEVAAALRTAERELEEATNDIHQWLHQGDAGAGGTGVSA
jgi:hypothetical protein